MDRNHHTFAKLVPAGLFALAVLGTTVATSGCVAEVYDDPVYYPSDAFVATEEPVYYDGMPVYFWGGLWYYRTLNGWGYYPREPPYLQQYRAAHPAVGRGGGRGRGGARGGGRSGGRGGGHGGRR